MKVRLVSDELHTELHEVIGHASGRQAPGFKGSPDADHSRSTTRRSRKARADLIALYFIGDPEARRAGDRSCRRSRERSSARKYDYYTRNAIIQLRRVREATQLEEATCATGR